MSKTPPSTGAATPLTMRFAPGLRDHLLETICRFEPEHYGVLAVRPEDPFRVVRFQPMPPLDGNSSRTFVQLNDRFIEYHLNVELLPRGLYIGGIIHSHPPGVTNLSSGVEGSGHGDVPSMRSALKRAQSLGGPAKAWTNFLAPIVTMNPKSWEPSFTGWTVRLDERDPIPTQIVFEDEVEHSTRNLVPHFPINEWVELGSHYQGYVNRVLSDRESPLDHREWMANFIHQAMRDDLIDRKAAFPRSTSTKP